MARGLRERIRPDEAASGFGLMITTPSELRNGSSARPTPLIGQDVNQERALGGVRTGLCTARSGAERFTATRLQPGWSPDGAAGQAVVQA